MRKRSSIHQSVHPFDPCPFEIFSHGSWRPVEELHIKAGAVTTRVINDGDSYEDNVQFQNLRIRSRRATLLDCTCYLRPGIDVCVLSTSQELEISSEEENLKPVYLDAKIESVERKPHDTGCHCQFHVSFLAGKRGNIAVEISQVFILQKLDRNPCENDYFRFESSEDCSSLQESPLFPGKFSSDLTWAVVASLYKKMSFDVKLILRKIVYQITEYDRNEIFLNSHDKVIALNFKVENRTTVPIVFAFNPSDILAEKIKKTEDDDGEYSVYDLLSLRRSKRRNTQPDRYIGCEISDIYFNKAQSRKHRNSDQEVILVDDESDLENKKKIDEKTNQTAKLQRRAPMFHQTDLVILMDSERSESCSEIAVSDSQANPDSKTNSRDKSNVPKQKVVTSNVASKINTKCHTKVIFSNSKQKHIESDEEFGNAKSIRKSEGSYKKVQRKRHSYRYSTVGNVRDTWASGKRSCDKTMLKEIMGKCIENIKGNIENEQPSVIDQWNKIQSVDSLDRCGGDESPSRNEVEKSEIDLLWEEMEMCLASMYLLGDNADSIVEVPQSSKNVIGQVCEHEYTLNEEIGILCQLCGHVETEIRYLMPKFLERSKFTYSNPYLYEGELNNKQDKDSVDDSFSLNTTSNIPLSEGEDNVWALIPSIRDKLRFHQKKAFEFLWHNIAGSLIPANMESTINKRAGCVISHTPGAGKTLLIIAFLESYLKLFPVSRPLVLAPKSALYTWYKEIEKWNISIPVYHIQSGSKRKGESSRISVKSPKRNRNYLRIWDCLEKIQKWVTEPSVLIMGYPSFLSLTQENTSCSYKQYMARVLRQSPGVLILDEGHNPRSTRSGLRKALMTVKTKLRILLSGTLFQNNFKEYYNTLALARPRFVDEVLRELDTKYKMRKGNVLSREGRARKLFVNEIAMKIKSESSEERVSGLNILRKLTSGFIDVYEGGSSNNLPGLQCYTLMMKSSPLQQELLAKLRNRKPHRSVPLELGALITLASIHPWLIQTAAYAKRHFTSQELKGLEICKFDHKFGPKVQFVMSLLPRCIIKNEKVLIFCFNIAPMNLLVEMFDLVFGWKRDEEVLVLTGDLELFERGKILEKFDNKRANSKVMLASITACGEGISLTAASRLILLDSQWNPAKTKQAIARAFRPGQEKVVYVYQLLASGTIEEDKYVKTTWKEWVSSMIFSEEVGEDQSRRRGENIEDDMLREIVEDNGASLFNMIVKNNEKACNDVVRGK